MGMTFLILFAMAEITLVALTFTKFSEKSAWLKNRVIVRTAETVLLLGMILLPTVNMKWRFFGALIVIAVRLIFAGIIWLIRHKKIQGMKKKLWSVVNCVLSVILVTVSLVPAFLFTNYNGLPTTGDYKVNQVSAILVDESRKDEFENDGSFREVPIYFFYPESKNGEFPLVIFSHGAFGYYQSNYSTYAELASNGYVVAALDHPHHSFFTEDTNGTIITVDSNFIDEVMKVSSIDNAADLNDEQVYEISRKWLKVRVDDENFVLDTIKSAKSSRSLDKAWHTDDEDTVMNVLSKTDTEKIGLIGHSLGGATSVTVGRERDDIDAIAVLDGTMLGEVKEIKNGKNVYYSEPYPIPVLDFTKEKDYNERMQYKIEHGYAYVNEYVTENAKDSKTVMVNYPSSKVNGLPASSSS